MGAYFKAPAVTELRFSFAAVQKQLPGGALQNRNS